MPETRSSASYETAVSLLDPDARVQLVYAFGSAARGEACPGSDVDLAVLLDRALSWDEERTFRAALVDAVPHLDVVILNGAPPVLRREVVEGGRCLLARDSRVQAEYELDSLSRFMDFQLVRRVQQRYLRDRVEQRRGSAG